MTFLETYAARRALDSFIKGTAEYLEKLKSRLSSSGPQLEQALERHLRQVSEWASEVQFADLKSPKQTTQIYVHLDCYVVPRSRIVPGEGVENKPLDSLFSDLHRHFVFLGGPGAGKTTSMKHVCNRILTDTTFALDRINYPLVIKLRDMAGRDSHKSIRLLQAIAEAVGLEIEYDVSLQGRSQTALDTRHKILCDVLCDYLDDTMALLILGRR